MLEFIIGVFIGINGAIVLVGMFAGNKQSETCYKCQNQQRLQRWAKGAQNG